jgi:hypothetical protein
MKYIDKYQYLEDACRREMDSEEISLRVFQGTNTE